MNHPFLHVLYPQVYQEYSLDFVSPVLLLVPLVEEAKTADC